MTDLDINLTPTQRNAIEAYAGHHNLSSMDVLKDDLLAKAIMQHSSSLDAAERFFGRLEAFRRSQRKLSMRRAWNATDWKVHQQNIQDLQRKSYVS